MPNRRTSVVPTFRESPSIAWAVPETGVADAGVQPEIKTNVAIAAERKSNSLTLEKWGTMTAAYYIYALKDPRTNPAKPFYIGKGTGTRKHDHLARIDETKKGKRIADIVADKQFPIVTTLADELTEIQAIKLEAELIAAFGLETRGGLLTNSVEPTGNAKGAKSSVVVPLGTREKAQLALQLLKDAVLELAKANPKGVRNSDVSKALGLQSDYAGGSKDYLAWSLLGLLMREGRMNRDNSLGKGRHVATVE